MPFLSKLQQRFMFANPEVLGGKDKVMEWAHETNFKKIPEHAKPKPRRRYKPEKKAAR